MRTDEIVAEVLGEAVGALSWMDGYTDPWPDGDQRRVSTVREIEGGVIKHFEVLRGWQDDVEVEILVSVRVLSDPSETMRS